jgi:hypothetical protein
MDAKQNTSLWDAVFKTDPKYTKEFTRGGGFKGTATNALYLIHKATELWGPMGGQWNVEIVEEKMLEGAPLMAGESVVGHELIHCVRINLRHPGGAVPAFGQTTFVGKNKYGFFTDEEAPKKSLTDALSKALSWLGFSADIHMGLYDDNKYVNQLKQEFSEQQDGTLSGAALDKHVQTTTAKVNACKTIEALNALWTEAIAGLDKEAQKQLVPAFKRRKSELNPAEMA